MRGVERNDDRQRRGLAAIGPAQRLRGRVVGVELLLQAKPQQRAGILGFEDVIDRQDRARGFLEAIASKLAHDRIERATAQCLGAGVRQVGSGRWHLDDQEAGALELVEMKIDAVALLGPVDIADDVGNRQSRRDRRGGKRHGRESQRRKRFRRGGVKSLEAEILVDQFGGNDPAALFLLKRRDHADERPARVENPRPRASRLDPAIVGDGGGAPDAAARAEHHEFAL